MATLITREEAEAASLKELSETKVVINEVMEAKELGAKARRLALRAELDELRPRRRSKNKKGSNDESTEATETTED